MEKNKRSIEKIKITEQGYILRELFYVLSAAVFIFLGLEYFFSGLVRAYININFVLILWMFIGIIMVRFDK